MNIFRLQYTLRMFSKQATAQGYAVIAPYEDKRVLLDVQPVDNTDLKELPEGCRAGKTIKSYGSFPVQTADVKQGYRGDYLFFDDDWYECVASSYYEHTPLRHWKSLYVRVSESGLDDEEPEEDYDDDY